ncbi:MAG: EAL domain-containing protein [Gammaproteobacteria bacterium]|nr:EAL domain-containing protein [Gammaproteobacteria bacterium]
MASNNDTISGELIAQLLTSTSVHDALDALLAHHPFLSSAEIYKKNDLSWSLVASAKNYEFDCPAVEQFEKFISQQSVHRLEFTSDVARVFSKQRGKQFFYMAFQSDEAKDKHFALILCGEAEEEITQELEQALTHLYPVFINLYQLRAAENSLLEAGKQAKAQAQALALNRSLLDNVGDAVFYHDEKGRFLDVNLQAIVSLGYSKAELLRKRVKDVDIGVNEGLPLAKILREKVKPGQPSTLQSWHLRKDGSRFPVEVTISSHDSGNFLAVVRDISKRTQIREELQKTKEFLESVIGLSESLIYVYDYKKDQFIQGASKLEKALGYPPGTINTLKDLLSYCHKDDLKTIHESLEQVFNPERKDPIEFDDRVLDASGKWRWVKNYFRVFDRAETGLPRMVICTATDVTQYKELEEKLIRSQNKYKALVENSFDAIAVFDKNNQISYASGAAYRMLDYKVGDAKEMYFDDFVAPEDRKLIVNAWHEILDNPAKPTTIEELRVLKKDGEAIWAKATLNNLLEDEFVQGIVANFSDLSSEKAALSEIQKKEHYYKSLVEKSFDGVVLYDASGKIMFASDNSIKLLGYNSYEDAPKQAMEYVFHEDYEIPQKAWSKLVLRPFESVDLQEYRLVKSDGSIMWIQNTLTNLLEDPNVAGIVSNFRDITAKKSTEQSLHKVSNYDLVSGLPNRNFLLEQLSQQVKKSSRGKTQFSLIILDINALNAINTAHGHTIGDAVLMKVAEKIKNTVSAEDFVAKTGDDEFAVILSDKTTYEVSRKCQEIIEQFKDLISVKNKKVKVALTAGISTYPKDALNAKNMITHSEVALKRAKSEVETFAFYKNHDSEITRYRLDLEKDLLEAISNDQLSMVYQPIVDARNGEVKYLESLLRWEHPEKGSIPPNLFVKIAEESNLISRLSEWVLDAVTKQIASWQQQGLSIQVTVNLSPKDIRRKNIAGIIIDVLDKYEVKPSSLAVEITESEELLDLKFVNSQMTELNQLGVGIILDDFGTGFSSVSHLLNLPITAAKVDKSFIHRSDTTNPQEINNFLKGVINLIQGSGVVTIIEGIETTEQFGYVKDLNEVYCQGYLFSKPKSSELITQLLKVKKLAVDELCTSQ